MCSREGWWKSPTAELLEIGSFKGAYCIEVAARTPQAFPRAPPGSGPCNAQSQQTHSFDGYDRTYAAPILVIVQRRAPCLCNADDCACATPTLMLVQCRPLSWASHIGPTPPSFHCRTNTTICKAMLNMDSELTHVESCIFADCDQHGKRSLSWWQSNFPKQRRN